MSQVSVYSVLARKRGHVQSPGSLLPFPLHLHYQSNHLDDHQICLALALKPQICSFLLCPGRFFADLDDFFRSLSFLAIFVVFDLDHDGAD